MNEKEEKLFFSLCNFMDEENTDIETLVAQNSSAQVLGELFLNRMQGIAFGRLKELNLLPKVNREFRNSLAMAYEQNIEKNKSYFICLEMLAKILKRKELEYAVLKGAVLCDLYPKGYRTSNDVDILIKPQDVTVLSSILFEAGFRQGYLRNGLFIPATRYDIIQSKMMRGETVPYIIEVNLPFMKFFEVDINFSLDYKTSDETVIDKMLEKTCCVPIGQNKLLTLYHNDFFVHLCCHLYKEATTLPWIEMKRDMTIYKFSDMYMFLSTMSTEAIVSMFDRAKEFDLCDVCACVILWTAQLFDIKNKDVLEIARNILKNDKSILNRVISPSDKKNYEYVNDNIKKRFFSKDRISLLKEVQK